MQKYQKLSRAEMKQVVGGNCTVTVYGANYSNPQTLPTNAHTSGQANSICVNLITEAGNGVNHCSYSCAQP